MQYPPPARSSQVLICQGLGQTVWVRDIVCAYRRARVACPRRDIMCVHMILCVRGWVRLSGSATWVRDISYGVVPDI